MRALLIAVAVLALAAQASATSATAKNPGQNPAVAPTQGMRPLRCGDIVICGNEKTPNNVIYELVELYSGAAIDAEMLRDVQRRLINSVLFAVNPWCGVWPTVRVIKHVGDGVDYWDVFITVQDKAD